jgi:hypothetical protein
MSHLMHMQAALGTLSPMPAEPTDYKAETVRTWVRDLAARKNTTPSGLALESNVSQPSISRFLRGDTDMLSPMNLARLAAVATQPVPPAIQEIIDRVGAVGRERLVNNLTPVFGEIPVWGTHPCVPEGEFRLNPVSLHHLARPPGMVASNKVVAFFAPDDTMAPRWFAGEPVFVDLARPGSYGDTVLIKLAALPDSPNESETALFRRYVARRDGHLIAGTFSDEEPVRIPLTRLLEVRRALTWSDLLG